MTYQALSKLIHDSRDGQPAAKVPSPPNITYALRTTTPRGAADLRIGAANERPKRLQAVTKEAAVTMTEVGTNEKEVKVCTGVSVQPAGGNEWM